MAVLPTIQAPKTRHYNMSTRIQSQAGQVIREQKVFAFMFTNTGNAIAYVNGMVVYPGTIGSILGDSRTVGVAQDDVEFVGNITVQFGAGSTPRVEIVQLFYTD